YFYSPTRTMLSVHVLFRKGYMTEFYPQAKEVPGRLKWDAVEVLPGEDLAFPHGEFDNHYDAARHTDAAPLRAGNEQEKLIFYRGIGEIDVPVRPKFTSGGKIEIRPAGTAPVSAVILFENRDGKVGYRAIGELKAP